MRPSSTPELSVATPILYNKNPALVAELLELGAGVHANTPGDAFAALQAGNVTAEQIVYSGTNLTDDDIELLTAAGIHLNLDSLDQLERFARIAPGGDVGLRMLMRTPRAAAASA